MGLDAVGQDLFEIVDQYGNENVTGLSPLTRLLRLKKELDREVCLCFFTLWVCLGTERSCSLGFFL